MPVSRRLRGVGRALGALPAAALAMAVLLPWGRLVERAGWRRARGVG